MDFTEIQAGDIASTKLKEQERWTANAVVDFNQADGLIEVTLKPELLEELKEKGDPIQILVVKEDYIYSISGVVEEIIIDYPDRLRVKVDSINKSPNNRSEARYDVWLNSIIRGQEIDTFEHSLVTNISRSGMAILSDHNLTISTEIFIDVQLGFGQILKFRGTPVRKRANGYRIEYGISSIPIDGMNAMLLIDYLKELEERNNNTTSIIKKIRERSAAGE